MKEDGKCKCCGGLGVQVNKDGLKIICPCCLGSGKWKISKPRFGVPTKYRTSRMEECKPNLTWE